MLKRITMFAMAFVCSLAFAGCGTIFYGERIGKKSSDKIDPTVLVLDCCGLLFGIIPGVIALALDFSNRTIYYSADSVPGAEGGTGTAEMTMLRVDDMSEEGIARALSEKLGRKIAYSDICFMR